MSVKERLQMKKNDKDEKGQYIRRSNKRKKERKKEK